MASFGFGWAALTAVDADVHPMGVSSVSHTWSTPELAHPCTHYCNKLLWGPSCSSLPVLWQRVSPRAFQSSPQHVKCKGSVCQCFILPNTSCMGEILVHADTSVSQRWGVVTNPVSPGFVPG